MQTDDKRNIAEELKILLEEYQEIKDDDLLFCELRKLVYLSPPQIDRPPNPFHKSGNFGRGWMSWNEQPEFDAFENGVRATLDRLAERSDEELTKTVGGLLSGVFEHMNNHTDFTPLYFERVAKELFTLILPILSARHQKKLQEAMEWVEKNSFIIISDMTKDVRTVLVPSESKTWQSKLKELGL